MHTDTTGLAATELQGEEAQEAVAHALAGDLTLQPIADAGRARVMSAKERDDAWARVRRDVHRDQLADLNSRVTNNRGLWA